MHLLIAAQKAILTNPESTPERKERAMSELRGIPLKDPRYLDAQGVLVELGLTAAPLAMDFSLIETLYATSNDPAAKPADREAAAKYLQENEDTIVAAYLALPDKQWGGDDRFPAKERQIGTPMYNGYRGVFASCAIWHQYDRLPYPDEADKVGIILAHRRITRPKARL